MVRSNLAGMYVDSGKYENAVSEYQTLLLSIERERDSVLTGSALSNLGAALIQTGRPAEALPRLQQAVGALDRAGSLQEKATALANTAAAHADLGDFGEADRYWAAALEVQMQLSDYAGQERTILSMSRSYLRRGDHRTALEWLLRGYQVVQQRPWSHLTADFQGAIGHTYFKLGDHVRAVEFLQPAIRSLLQVQDWAGVLEIYDFYLPVIIQSEDPHQLADAYYDIGTAYHQTRQSEKAIEHFRKMFPLLEATDPTALAIVYNNIGGCYMATEEYAEAQAWFQKSLGHLRANDPSAPCGLTLLNIGLASLKLQEFARAAEFLEQAHEEFSNETTPVPAHVQAAKTHLAFAKDMAALAASGQDTTAQVRELRLTQMNTAVRDDVPAGRALVANGHSRMEEQNFASAQEAFTQAQVLFARLGAKQDLAATRRCIGDAALAQNKPDEAILHFVGALADFEKLGDDIEVSETARALGVVNEQLERYSVAIAFYKRAFRAGKNINDPGLRMTALADTLRNLADVIATHGEPSEATPILELALDQAVDCNEIDDAERYAAHLARLYETLGNIDGRGRALANLGNAARLTGRYAESLDRFEEAAQCFRAVNNEAHLRFSLSMIRELKRNAAVAADPHRAPD
jgi:tetratricopeptide (TPR) repeat protein